MNIVQTIAHWTKGVRLYIAIGGLLVTAQAWWWASTAYSGDPDLIAARLHEVYGWLALSILFVTLCIGPVYKLLPNLGGIKLMRDARRLLGVSSAWFAVLHASIAYFVSFKAISIFEITATYRLAFALGAAALLILAAMAGTSFNGLMKRMGIWWFRLHRLVYAAVALAVWHAFIIGVHATTVSALVSLVGFSILLFVGHISIVCLQDKRLSVWRVAMLCLALVTLATLGNYGIQQYVDHNSLQRHGHL